MVRTQVLLPDALYGEVQRIAAEREVSLAEVIRRGLEHMVRLYPPASPGAREPGLPSPLHLGALQSSPASWREVANGTEPRPERGRSTRRRR